MLRQIVPEGYTFGWKSGGTNLHLGGFDGYSSLNSSVTLYTPPSQSVPSFPGMPVSQNMIFDEPSPLETGRAWKPNGWSLRHALRSYNYIFIYYSTFINDRQRCMSVVRYWYQIIIIYYKNKSLSIKKWHTHDMTYVTWMTFASGV